MTRPPELQEFLDTLAQCREGLKVLDLAVLGHREGDGFSLLSARFTVGSSAKTMEPMAVFRPNWFVLRQQRRVDDLYFLIDAIQNGAPLQKLVHGQPGNLFFSQRPRGWFTNGIGQSNATLLGADGAALRIGATWSKLFVRPEDFRVWQNDVNTLDDVHNLDDLVRRYALRQPLTRNDHARQLHLELEFPIYFRNAVSRPGKTQLYFSGHVADPTQSKIKWRSADEFGVAQLVRVEGSLAVATIDNELKEVAVAPVCYGVALPEFWTTSQEERTDVDAPTHQMNVQASTASIATVYEEVLQFLAEKHVATSTPPRKDSLKPLSRGTAGTSMDDVVAELARRGHVDDSNEECIWLTLDGWLLTSFRTQVWSVVDVTLKVSRAHAAAGDGIPTFDWSEIRAHSGLGEELRPFCWWVLKQARIGQQAAYTSNGVWFQASSDHHRWDAVDRLEAFLRIHRSESIEHLVQGRRLGKDERVACERIYAHFRANGEWPRSRLLNVELDNDRIDLVRVVGASMLVRGTDITSNDAKSYLTLYGLLTLDAARSDLEAVVSTLRVLGERHAAAPEIIEYSADEVCRVAGVHDAEAVLRVLRILDAQGGPFVVENASQPDKAMLRTDGRFLECRRIDSDRAFVRWLRRALPSRLSSASVPNSAVVDDRAQLERGLTDGESPKFNGPMPWLDNEPIAFKTAPVWFESNPGVDVLLVTATATEQKAVLRRMRPPVGDPAIIKVPIARNTYFVGMIGESRVALVMSRIGPGMRDGSGPTVADAINDCLPRAVIAVGIAWGMKTSKLKIGDVLVSTRIIPFDSMRREAAGDKTRAAQPEAGGLLLNRFRNETSLRFRRPDGHICRVYDGPLLSGQSLVDDLGFKTQLHRQFHDAIGGEMEGEGVYGSTAKHNGEWIIVKAVCDWGDGKKNDDYQSLAAASAMSLVEQVIESRGTLNGLEHMGRARLVPGKASAASAPPDSQKEETVTAAQEAHNSAANLVARWKRRYKFSAHHLVRLRLRKQSPKSTSSREVEEMDLEQVVHEVRKACHVVIAGRPGAGKTLTLIQLAELMCQDESAPKPVILSVAGWVSSGVGLKSFVAQQLFDDEQRDGKTHSLLQRGSVALLLNGWNEAEEKLQVSANEALRAFNLMYPDVPIVITTRDAKVQPAAVDAIVLMVADLSADQKAALVKASGIARPDKLLEELRASPGLEVVTDTPLFLAAAIQLAIKGRSVPGTRALLLEAFVDEIEQTDNHLDVLMSGPCRGLHRRYLERIADVMLRGGLTVLGADECHRALARLSQDLVRDGELGSVTSGSEIADSLVRHHILVSVPGARLGYEFVHQQFQEVFGARSLERRARALINNPDQATLLTLQREVLDHEQWRVPIELTLELFASTNEQAASAHMIRWIASLDLIVAAELCNVAGPDAWKLLRDELAPILRRLYAVGGNHRACGLAAMLAIGEADFADIITAEIEGAGQRFYELMTLCRAYLPFRPTSLGAGWQDRVANWPEDTQQAFFLEVFAGDAELAFAEQRALSAAASVRKAAFALLGHQGQLDRIIRVLTATSESEWMPQILVAHWRSLPHDLQERFIKTAVERFETADVNERRSIVAGLRIADDARWIALAWQEMERAFGQLHQPSEQVVPGAVPVPVATIAHYTPILRDADSPRTQAWLATRLGRLLWQKPFVSYLEWFLDETLDARFGAITETTEVLSVAHAVSAIVANGRRALECVLRLYLRSGNEYLRDALGQIPISTLGPSITHLASLFSSLKDAEALIGLVLPNQPSEPRLDEPLDPTLSGELRALVLRAALALPNDPVENQSSRARLALLLGCVGNRSDVAILTKWTDDERKRWEEYYSKPDNERRQLASFGASWWRWYRSAIARLDSHDAEPVLARWLDSEYLIGDGAWGLVQLSYIDGALPPLDAPLLNVSTSPSEVVRLPKVPRPQRDPRVRARSMLIVDALARVRGAGNGDARRARADAVVALANLNDEHALKLLLREDSPLTDLQTVDAAFALVQRGTLLPGLELGRRLEAFLDARTTRSRLDEIDSFAGVVRALAVLLASDDPTAGIERMASLFAGRPPVHVVRSLCTLLAASSNIAAISVLIDISCSSTSDDDARHREVIRALAQCTNPKAHERVLDAMCEPMRSDDLSELLTRSAIELAMSHPSFIGAVIARLEGASADVAVRLATVLAEVGGEQAAMALLRYPDAELVEWSLRRLVNQMTHTRTPLANAPGSYLLQPRESASLRRSIAAQLMSRDRKRSGVASRLLVQIRITRVEAGALVQNEPLHPDVSLMERMGVNWELCG